ncbi:conserved domain protein [Actinomyces sp. oral taxon 170 str. F0386]|nr:conserved domain protein [Actinomyces sp. oral taxon 170 str. F0386]
MSNLPDQESLLSTPRTSGAARPVRPRRERADRVQIGDKGSERTHTDERKPHDSAIHIDGQGVLAVLCHRFGHSDP